MSSQPGYIRAAARESLAEGLREHVPGTVGILLKGVAVLVLAAVAVALGLPLSLVTPLASLGAGGVAAYELHARRLDKKEPD